MGAAVAITRLDLTASELRKAAQGEGQHGGAADAGTCACSGRRGPQAGSGELRDGSPDSGLGAPLQYGRLGRPSVAQAAWSFSETHRAAGGRTGRACRSRPRSGAAWGGALAAD